MTMYILVIQANPRSRPTYLAPPLIIIIIIIIVIIIIINSKSVFFQD